MQKTIAIALAVLMVGVMTPSASAETVSSDYTLAMGISGVFGLIICQGPPEQEICEDNGIAPIGGYGADRTGSGTLFNLAVSIADDVFGSDVFGGICVYAASHSVCGSHPDDAFASGCGGISLAVPTGITSDNHVAGFVYNIHVEPDLGICGGTSGTASVSYF